MKFINYTTPKLLIADEGKHIRDINDTYTEAVLDEEGNVIEEARTPYYATVIFLSSEITDISEIEELYVEEEI